MKQDLLALNVKLYILLNFYTHRIRHRGNRGVWEKRGLANVGTKYGFWHEGGFASIIDSNY